MWGPKWYKDTCFWYFYDDESKNFFRRFAAIYNFYIELYRYHVGEHIGADKNVGFWSSIQLYISRLGDDLLQINMSTFSMRALI